MSRSTLGPLAALSVVVVATLGCASGSVISADDAMFTSSVPAGNCEVFVDRAAPHFDSHGVEQLTLYVKTPLGKLDAHGGIASAGYHAQATADGKAGPFQDMPGEKFVGAEDYWVLTFTIGSDFSPTTTFKGAFYVEAKDHSRLWLNAPEGGPDFMVDSNMVQNLAKLRPEGFFATSGNTSPPKAVVAADEFPYLNPQRCR
jgi:hypothetical protein